MLLRIFGFLVGFGLTIIGFICIIGYANLMTIGYNFSEYVNFIIREIECLLAPIGIMLMLICIFVPGGEKNEIYLWRYIKF